VVALSSSGGSGEGTLSQLAVGELCMVEVVGKSRIGKSRLLSELASRAARRDYLVLGGRAAEFEQDVPLGLIVKAMNDHLVRSSRRFWITRYRPGVVAAFAERGRASRCS
jgi:predicted ATPase